MPIPRFIALVFAGVSLTVNNGSANLVAAPTDFVYEVIASDCKAGPISRSQTGFRLRGTKGIVTALHGVANCATIRVKKVHGLVFEHPLVISRVDFERDVALLTSEELNANTTDGLEPLTAVNWASVGPLRAVGHPYGISLLVENLAVRSEPVVNLRALLPTSVALQLKDRKSPGLEIRVISLTGGHLLPGHSGAPIIDLRDRVIGVANGGLEAGHTDISWAIPINDIHWVPKGIVASNIASLAYRDAGTLFAFDRAQPDELAGAPAEAFLGLMLPTAQTILKITLSASSDVDEAVAKLALRDELGTREYSADEQVRPPYLLAVAVATRSVATPDCSSAIEASAAYRVRDLIASKEISSGETHASTCVIEDLQKATNEAIRAAVSKISVVELANQIRANSP